MDILETKKNLLQHELPARMKTDRILPIFKSLIDDRVYEFIGKKVSNLNGDIRQAFNMMKDAVKQLRDDVSRKGECLDGAAFLPDHEIRITIETILKVYEDK